MANDRLIEVISPQSYEAIQKLNKELLDSLNLTIKWNDELTKNKSLTPSSAKKAYTETATAIKSAQASISDYEKTVKKLETSEKRQLEASLKINTAIQKRRFETAQLNREAKQQAILSSKLSTEYQKQGVKLAQLRKAYKDLAVRQELHSNLTKEEVAEMKRLEIQANKIDTALKKVDRSVGQSQRNVGNYQSALSGLRSTFVSLIGAFGLTSGVMIFAQMIKGAINNVKEFDSGLKNVQKTTGLTSKEIEGLGDDIVKLSRKLQTVGTKSLLEYATVAGQLGVKGSQNILAFTEALAKLETASDITGQEGGASIARLLTLTDGGVQNVSDFGDEIVKLGNNFAATESEILGNATAIAQNTGIYKLGRQSVLAYATATKAVGIESEITGSTIGKTLGLIEKSLRTGQGLDAIVKLTGKNVDELQKLFKEDAGAVFTSLLKGLNNVDKAGESVNEQLENLGISAVRDQRVIGSLATAGYGTLARAMDDVTKSSGALQDEFDLASTKLVNQYNRVKIAWDNFILSIEKGNGVIAKVVNFGFGQLANSIEIITHASENAGTTFKALAGILTFNSTLIKSANNDYKEMARQQAISSKATDAQTTAFIEQHGSLAPLTEEQTRYIKNLENINFLNAGTEDEVKKSNSIKNLQDRLSELNTELLDLDVTDKKGIANKKEDIRLLTNQINAILGVTTAVRAKTKEREKEVTQLNALVDALRNLETINNKIKRQAGEALNDTTANTDALEKQNEALQRQAAINNKKAADEAYATEKIKGAFISLGVELGIQEDTISNLFDNINNGFHDTEASISSFTALFQDALNVMTATSAQRSQERLDMLQKERDISIAFAGESAAAKGAIEERYQRQVAQEKTKQAKREKTAAMISAVINTAAAVVKTFAQLGFPAGLAAAGIIGALGAAQVAVIASQPIPQFKDGVENFGGGNAIVGDGGKHEPITDKSGRLIGVSPNRSTLVNLPKGSNVYKDYDTFNKHLNGVLGDNGINPLGGALSSPMIVFNGGSDKGMTAQEMERVMLKTLGSMPMQKTIIDKDGIKTFAQNQYSKGVSLNNRVTRKGLSV